MARLGELLGDLIEEVIEIRKERQKE